MTWPSSSQEMLAAVPPDDPGTWKLIGAALIIAAIVGGGLKFFDIQFPVLRKYWQNVLLLVAGAISLGYGWQLDKFRLSKLALEVPGRYVGSCPASVPVTGTIRVRGGKGVVDYRWLYSGNETKIQKLRFERSGGEALPLATLRFARSAVTYVQVRVLAPDTKTSRRYPIKVECRRPLRGFARYHTDGYDTVYPDRWRIAENDVVRTTYHRTKFISGDGDYFVLIDWTPGVNHLVEPQLSADTQVLVNGRRVQLGSHRAREWRFVYQGQERVDYVFLDGGDQFAILAEGPDFPAIASVASRVASEITLR